MLIRFLSLLAVPLTATAQTPESLFQTHCATCHNPASPTGAPLPETLHQMPSRVILAALETGKMKAVGDRLTATEREAVARWVGTKEAQPVAQSGLCGGAEPVSSGAPGWNGWADAANTRFQSAKASGLSRQMVPRLKLKWAFGFPGVTTAFGAPTLIDGRLFIGAADGAVYSLDADTGCTFWTYAAEAGVRTAPAVDERAVYFGDLHGNVYGLDLRFGRQLWKVRAEEHPLSVITGSPKLDGGRIYVPVSGRDESIAAIDPTYQCCTFRGSVVALDAATGKKIWTSYTISDEPKVTGKNAKGTMTWGPSGAVPWSSPTLDLQKRVLYIGTGVNYSKPPTSTSDAVVAFDMESGRLLWSRQLTTEDTYNFACGASDKSNCPRDPFIDSDFGNSGMLRSLGGGQRILVISDKGGMVYALDPDKEGALVWTQKIAAGGVNGGTMWGGAIDDRGIAYIGISDFTAGKPETGGGLIALHVATGQKLWKTPAPKPGCLATPGCSAAQPAPVTVIPGVVFLGSWDGHIRAYETDLGEIIWDFDTLRDFQSVNGVKARGGSINSMGPTVADGMLFMTSGYSGNAIPGNVLLAFSVDGK